MRFPDSIFPRFRMVPKFEFPQIPRFGAFARFPDSMGPDSNQIKAGLGARQLVPQEVEDWREGSLTEVGLERRQQTGAELEG